MKQKLTLLGLSGLLLLAGCRADDMITNAKRQEDLAKKFSVFTKTTDNEMIDYPSGFARLALRYDSLHHKNLSGRRALERLKTLSKKNEVAPTAVEAEAYIDFNIRSQTIVEKNGDRWVVFPRIKGGKVAELVAGVLSEEETQVHFYSLKPDTEIYKTNAHLFEGKYRNRYASKVNQTNLFELLPLTVCSRKQNQMGECIIDEVIIAPPFPDTGGGGGGGGWFLGSDEGNAGGSAGGGCTKYAMCMSDNNSGGGGGGSDNSQPPPPQNPPTDPCEKAKTGVNNANEIAKNTKFTSAKNGIMAAFNNNGKENGVAFGKDSPNGALNATEVQNYQQNSGTVISPYAYPVADMHNHPNGNPPSVGDVYSMMQHHLEHGSFSTRYVITSDGSMYALIVTDTEAIRKFLQDYPPSQIPGHNPNFPEALSNEWNNIRFDFSESGALAHILTKYNAGVSLSKADSNGRFRNINVNERHDPQGPTYTYTLCP
ncbi:hypothetical protein [Bergeyella sp. RCAD1439]|uniref:hypothetical protein n=1 Tax=Bergeyella anatis TaxID=3113737 RepID=UPI002E1741CC|nr:hypothetical protein [Bergeyella sp. RCAD1439]